MLEKIIGAMLGYVFVLLGFAFSSGLSIALYGMYTSHDVGIVFTVLITPLLLFTIVIVPIVFCGLAYDVYKNGGLSC